MAGGRPTKYNPEYHPKKAYELCYEFGSTDRQLAKFFEVDLATIHNWKKAYPEEFFSQIRAGKDYYNSKKMEKSLRKRGMGYRYTETIREMRTPTVINELGEKVQGTPKLQVVKTISKHIPGDVHAQKFWLTKRDPERWPDKQQIDLSGGLNVNVNEMTEKHKAELKEIALLRAELALRERREDGEQPADNGSGQ